MLLEQGYSEVVEVDIPQPQPLPQQQQPPLALPMSAGAPVPLPTTLTPRVPTGQSRSPPKELSKLTYERNEKIYQVDAALVIECLQAAGQVVEIYPRLMWMSLGRHGAMLPFAVLS